VPGLISASENIQIALNFARCDPSKTSKNPVLFIFFTSNMHDQCSFKRIGQAKYSVYDYEKEVVYISPFMDVMKIT